MKGLNIGEKSKKLSRGYLFQRNKNYYVRFKINGKQFCKVLQDDEGNTITEYRKAEKAREKLLAPFVIKDKKALKENLLDSIKSDTDKQQEAVKQADDILNPPLMLSEGFQAYVDNQSRPQKTKEQNLKNYEAYYRKFCDWLKVKHPDITRLKEVSKEIASEYCLQLKKGISPGTFNKHRDFLKILFHYLRDQAKMNFNPFEAIKRLDQEETPTRRPLTDEEAKTAITRAEGDLKTLLLLGYYTGMRLGDCITLKWSEIDLEKKLIVRTLNKTKETVKVGIPPDLHFQLSLYRKRIGYLFPKMAEKYNSTNRQAIPKMIQAHFENCGIKTHAEGTGQGTGKKAVVEIGFHSLRHGYISKLAASGISQNILVKLAGHSSQMSEYYTHLNEGKAVEIAQHAFKGILSSATDPITVESFTDKERIEQALEYIRSAAIPEEFKISILSILEG